jgi:glycosyltransferase involved in cell wall biosynthesis/tetratricopeptide (TPR) repeat protein
MATLKNCPLCNGEAIPPPSLRNQERFSLCQRCGSLFDKEPHLIDYKNQFYDTNPFFSLKPYLEKGASLHFFAHLLLLTEYALRLINPTESLDARTLKLLEIGCGPGLLLDMARYFGWDVQGVEPSVEASDFGRDVLELPILPELFTADLRIEGMDVVITSEVIEHLTSPTSFLNDIFNALSDSGVALFTTPNAESKTLEEQGDSWIYLGKDHLILYTVPSLAILLEKAGFKSVTLWTFEGEYNDERIIAIAAKKKIAESVMDTVRRDFGSHSAALNRCIRYLRYTLDRFEKQKNVIWQGAFYRLVESLNAAQQYSESISTANRLEKFLQNEGHSYEAVMSTLDKAHKAHNRSLFYSRVPTFIGNLYLAKGLALLQMGKVNEALDDFYHAHAITEKLEALPDKSYEEIAGMPPSLHALFHVGYALFLLGSNDESASIFEKLLARRNTLTRDALVHTLLNYGRALKRQRRLDEAINSFKEVTVLSQSHNTGLEIVQQAALELSEAQISIAAELRREKDSAEEEKKTLAAKLQAERDSLIAAEEEKKILAAKLQAERDSLMAEQIRLRQKNDQLQVLNQRLHSLNQDRETLSATLRRIYESHGWKALLAYYQLRNWVFPPGSKRQNFAKAVFHFLSGDKKKDLANNTFTHQSISPTHTRRSPALGPIDLAACTIVSKNYLPYARTLCHSFHKYHPNTPFFVLLVDRVDGYFQPEHEPFYTIGIEDLDIPDHYGFCFKYTILELNTAAKPYFLSYLFDKHGVQKLIYLDPDILIFRSVSHIVELLANNSIILTPHLTVPIEDNYRLNELDILLAGVYNLGFIAISQTPTTRNFLEWWQKRLYENCLMALDKGMHVDQKWMDLVPGFFDGVYILRHPGYNVAYWNLHGRSIEFKNGDVLVNGEPCYFFHFSGMNPEKLGPISKHQNRFTMTNVGQAARLFEEYRDLVFSNGYKQTKDWPYAFACFDNDVKIPDIARLMYHALTNERKRFGNPFSTNSGQSFFNWLNEPVDGKGRFGGAVTRLWYEIYHQRPDVQRAYPDVVGKDREAFLGWILTGGNPEYKIDERLLPQRRETAAFVPIKSGNVTWRLYFYLNVLRPLEVAVKPTLKQTLGRNQWVWSKLKEARNRLNGNHPPPVTEIMATNMPQPANSKTRPFGVNVAGYFSSEKGVGEAGRASVRALQAAAIPYVLNNFVDSGSLNADSSFIDFEEDNPFSVNLIHVNADQVPVFASRKGVAYFRGRYNIGCWFWELSDFPEEWYPSFEYFDEIWAASSFIQTALSRVSPIPVIRIPLSLAPEVQATSGLDRAYFGLSNNSFIFLSMFDCDSTLERKNPLGVVEAFKMAFGENDRAFLFLKSAHANHNPSALETVQTAVSKAKNIRIVDKVFSRAEINALVATCDCYVSLHRSEGFGLPIAESMRLAKPVIVTGYSGNMDFTTPQNSFLIDYQLSTINEDHGPYRKGYVWADPDLNQAAELMRHVYENVEKAREFGRRARQDILELLSPRAVGQQISQRLMRMASMGKIGYPDDIQQPSS